MLRKIALIDPVGAKSGMNSYDLALATGFSSHETEVRIYSNFLLPSAESESIVCKSWFKLERANRLTAVLRIILNVIRSLIDCKRNDVRWVVLHQFNSNVVTFITFALSKLFFMRLVNIVHDLNSLGNDDVKVFRSLILNRFSDLLCVHNETVQDSLLEVLTQRAKRKIFRAPHVSYMDVVNTNISLTVARKQLNLHECKTYVLFFGQIKRQKGLGLLIKAMTSLPNDVNLIVAGKPWKDEIASYHELVLELGLSDRVIFDSKYISDYFRDMYFTAADTVVLPYTEIYESGVLRMAMDFGIPVVASDIPVLASQVNDSKCGVLFKSGDIESLAMKINGLLVDNNRMKTFAENGRKYSYKMNNSKYIASLFLDKISAQV